MNARRFVAVPSPVMGNSVFARGFRMSVVGLAAAVAVTLAAPAAPRAAAISVLNFTIEDGYDVADDGLGDYRDFRIDPSSPGDLNYCVEAPASNFLSLNRDLDALGGGGTQKCDDDYSVTPPAAQHSRRQFFLHITSAAVCTELMDNNYGEPDGGTGCFLNGYRNPRLRLDKLFGGGRPRSTPVDFLIGRNPDDPNYLSAWTYRVESDQEGAIVIQGNIRTVTYNGPFRLVKVGYTLPKGKNAQLPAWASPFNMSLLMTFEVIAVQ